MNIFIIISLICGAWISTSSANHASKCLHAHNVFRALHAGTKNLRWDPALAYEAQVWAKRLVGLNAMQHSRVKGQGENIYYKKGQRAGTCAEAVHAWYSEIKDYNYNYPGFSSATGHFTQVIWKGSTYVGVGIATSKRNGQITTFIVAKYVPQGNMRGQFKKNVLPKTSAKMPTIYQIDPSPTTPRRERRGEGEEEILKFDTFAVIFNNEVGLAKVNVAVLDLKEAYLLPQKVNRKINTREIRVCRDAKSKSMCKMYFDYKFCVKYRKYMGDYCAKTCGIC